MKPKRQESVPQEDLLSLTRRRKRVSEAGCEWLLSETIEAGERAGALKRRIFKVVIVDATVQERALAHPSDSRQLNTAREKLVEAVQSEGIDLRQSDAQVGPQKRLQAGRYARAKHTSACTASSAACAPGRFG